MPPADPVQPQPHVRVQCVRAATGATTAVVQRSRAPLHVAMLHRVTPLLGPHALSLALVHTGGALLPGDSLSVDLRLDPGSRLHVTTVGATCVHGPSLLVTHAPPSLLHTRYTLASDARFVMVPHAIIPFARATLRTWTEVCLQEGAVCAIGEILAAGRVARGEVFAFRQMCSTLTLSIGGRMLAMDRLRLPPLIDCTDQDIPAPQLAAMHPAAALAWGVYTHLATLWLSAPWVDDALVARLHAEIQRLVPDAELAVGSATHAQGPVVLVRLLGHSAQSLKSILEQLSALALHGDR